MSILVKKEPGDPGMSDDVKPEKPSAHSSSQHLCCLCSATLPSKEELQDHFRKHANKEIDYRGKPMSKRFVLPQESPKVLKKVIAPVPKISEPDVQNPQTSAVVTSLKTVKSSTVYGTKLKNVRIIEKKVETPVKEEPKTEAPPPPVPSTETPASINCDVCGQAFETVTFAIQHKFRKHPNSSLKYFCPYCGMQFPLKYNQETHIAKNHAGEEPKGEFPCSDCGASFSTADAHTYHIKSTHKRIVAFFKPIVTPPPSKKIKLNNANEAQSVYYCHLCGFEYIVKFNLQKHLEKQHTEKERDGMPSSLMKCTTCDALFYNKKAYDNHNMYHKPDDLYVTSEEQRLQTVSRVDQDFDIRRVIQPVDKYMAKVRPAMVTKRRSRDAPIKPTLSSLSDSELSPASTPPTSDSEDEPDEKIVEVVSKASKKVVKEPVAEVEKKKIESPKSCPASPKRRKKVQSPEASTVPVRRNCVRSTRSSKKLID